MYEYNCEVERIVDGDTIDVVLDLGFDILYRCRVRLYGIDTPESRTSDKVEDLFGEAAKARVGQLMGETAILKTQINKNGEDMKGKFGRILGDFVLGDKMLTEILIEEGHAVPYTGGSKADTVAAHEANRQRLVSEGIVAKEDYDREIAKQNS